MFTLTAGLIMMVSPIRAKQDTALQLAAERSVGKYPT